MTTERKGKDGFWVEDRYEDDRNGAKAGEEKIFSSDRMKITESNLVRGNKSGEGKGSCLVIDDETRDFNETRNLIVRNFSVQPTKTIQAVWLFMATAFEANEDRLIQRQN